MFWLQIALFVVFLICGTVYGRASKDLSRLDSLRLEKEIEKVPVDARDAARMAAQRLGTKMMIGSEELKAFCAKNDLAETYVRATRRIYGAMLVAIMCAYFIIRLIPKEAMTP